MAAALKGTVFITGANGGLGSRIVHQIVHSAEFSSFYGVYTVRDPANATALDAKLKSGTDHQHETVALDLGKLDMVRSVAAQVNSRVAARELPPIRVLILNAGSQDFGQQTWTGDGFDTTFASNYLGHWLLTLLLLQSIDKENGRIIVIGSQSHDPLDSRNASSGAFADPESRTVLSADADNFLAIAKGEWNRSPDNGGFQETFKTSFRRYGASKLFVIMMQHELQARLNTDPSLSRIAVLGVDPGTMVSGLTRKAPWFIRIVVFGIVFPFILWLKPDNTVVSSPKRSAPDILEAAFGAGQGGEPPKDSYFVGRQPFETSLESKDPVKRELVWRKTKELTGLKAGETALARWE